ncbi:MAG: CheR family methyltransferase [Bacteroidales bacterium]
MNVHGIDTRKSHHISIQGNMQSQADREAFFTLLRPDHHKEVELTFFDARILPADVMTAIKSFAETNRLVKLKINVFHRYLGSYFFRLGLSCHVMQQHSPEYRETKKIKAIALGGSAGSLDKIMLIMAKLPPRDVSVFIVQHILEKEPNYLGELLERSTGFKVAPTANNTLIKTNCVYIAPPGHHMMVEKGKIRLSTEARINFARPSIQVTFESLAHEYRDGLITVMLCGYGDDGNKAFGLLKEFGATTIIEDPEDCDARDLVLNAWKTGLIDYKFPLPELTSYLARIVEPETPNIDEADLKRFFNNLNDHYGYDYRHYNVQSATRRIARVMADHHIYSFRRFEEFVLQDRDLFENLFLECSINVTEFFRNPLTFLSIRQKVLTYLDSFPHIKIWSAGCSTGQEAVTLAIMLDELGILHKSQIYASDINPYVVEEAQNGIYSLEMVENSRENYIASGGTADFDNYFTIKDSYAQVKPHLKDRILYFQHSLLNKGVFNEFHLILCRNVLIYFDQTLQSAVLDLFYRSLDMNGFLVLGESESIASYPIGFQIFDKSNKIFKKII